MLRMLTGKFSPEIFFEGSKCKENLNLNIEILVNKEEKATEFIGGTTICLNGFLCSSGCILTFQCYILDGYIFPALFPY